MIILLFFICALIFCIGTFVWFNKSNLICEEVDEANLTPSDYTLEFHNWPENSSNTDIEKYLINIEL